MQSDRATAGQSPGEYVVRQLYYELLNCWNRQRAAGMAALFADDGASIGFDGSVLVGRHEIATVLDKIFTDHPTARFVSIVRSVCLLSPEVAVLRAVAGMVPRGQLELNPAVNAVQSLVTVQQDGRPRIALFQNTPAAFHGRPVEAEQLTAELRQALQSGSADVLPG